MCSISTGVPERRRAPRAPLGLDVVYATGSLKEAVSLSELRRGRILNLSYSGAQVVLVNQFPAGTRLGVFLIADFGTIQAEAEVTWSRRVPETLAVEAFKHGLKFLVRSPQFDEFVAGATTRWQPWRYGS